MLACGFNRNGRCGVPDEDPATTRSEDDDALLLRPTRCAAAEQACAGGATIVAMAAGSGHAGFVCSDGTARLFGRDADFAEHFLNSDGPRAARVAPRQPCRAAVNGAGGVWRSSCV